MNAYPEYKESGIDWLGKIPSHWIVAKLGRVLEGIQDGTHGSYNRVDIGYPLLSAKNVTEDGIIVSDNESLINETDYRNIIANGYPQKGDIAMCCVATIGRGCIYQLDEPQAFQRSVTFLRINRNHSNAYILYFLRSVYGQTQFSTFAKTSAQGGVYMGDLKQFNLVLPLIDEQKAIAAYLDEKTGKIDKLIAEKTKQVEDLRSFRTSVITEAVTRGLNPNAPLRQSCIDWLGVIPEHWEIYKLKYLTTKIGSGITPKGGAEVYQENGVLFLRSQNIYNDGLRLSEQIFISSEIDEQMSNTRVYPNDILLNITGASIGRCSIYTLAIPANVNQHVCIIRPTSQTLATFLHYVLCSSIGQVQISLYQTGGNREGLNFEQLKNFIIPVPPISEQQEIADYLDEKTAKIDKLISELNHQLAELAEYKQAVISEAVTGKVDVRNYKSKL